jgi:hypothetical protein
MKEAQETMNERPFLLLLHDLIVDLEFDLTKERERTRIVTTPCAPQQDGILQGRRR